MSRTKAFLTICRGPSLRRLSRIRQSRLTRIAVGSGFEGTTADPAASVLPLVDDLLHLHVPGRLPRNHDDVQVLGPERQRAAKSFAYQALSSIADDRFAHASRYRDPDARSTALGVRRKLGIYGGEKQQNEVFGDDATATCLNSLKFGALSQTTRRRKASRLARLGHATSGMP
jgi:hypothetical protein